jgi:predicted MPP superfamily phosphohydrolase
MRITRRKFALGLGAAGLLGVAYSRCLESRWLELREVVVTLPRVGLRSPFRILHLSDFHWSSAVPLSFIEKAIKCGLAKNPDLICLTGDFATAGEQHDLQRYEGVLGLLSSAAPSIAVLGNHDGGVWSRKQGGFPDRSAMTTMLRNAGVTVLQNESRVLGIKGNKITLVGTADLWSGWFDAGAPFKGLSDEYDGVRIVLSHNPDTKDALDLHPWDLMLSGHTHGGQIVIPLLGPPIVRVHDRGYVSGLNRWRDRWIYTTRGVGSLYGIRFNCRPEVSILDVTPTEANQEAEHA